MTEVQFSRYWPRVQAWVEDNGLDLLFSRAHPEHDVIHVLLDLSVTEEGIVLAVENCIAEYDDRPTEDEFTSDCFLFHLPDTDTFSEERTREIYVGFMELWPIRLINDLRRK